MKIFSKLSNVQSFNGIRIRPGLNNIGAKKVETIKKHPKLRKHFDNGNFKEVVDQPKKKLQSKLNPEPPITPPKDNPKTEPEPETKAEDTKKKK